MTKSNFSFSVKESFCLTSTIAAIGLLLPSLSAQAATLVDLELSLLVDVSGSVSSSEFNLQKQGYVDAFRDPDVVEAIQNKGKGKIAANLIYWSSSSQQVEAVTWSLIEDTASATAFANAIESTVRPFSGGTQPDAAINFAVPLFGTETGNVDNGFLSDRQVIDVSGDGPGNVSNTQAARDAALTAGIDAINGLAIGSQFIFDFYNDNIKGGDDAFVILANDFENFDTAIKQKLAAEIGDDPDDPTSVPESTSILSLLAFSVFGAGFSLLRKQREKTLG